MILASLYFPHIAVLNAEKRRSIAISALEILRKQSRSFYFAVDSSLFNNYRLPFYFFVNSSGNVW